MEDLSYIYGRNFVRKMAIVNCDWNVIFWQDNIIVSKLNHSEPSCGPGIARQGIWRIPHFWGADSLRASCQLRMGCHIKARQCQSRFVKWTIQSHHGALEQPTSSFKSFEGCIIYGGKQLLREFVTGNWGRDVQLRQDNVMVCHLNHTEPRNSLEQPVYCIFADIWRIHFWLG